MLLDGGIHCCSLIKSLQTACAIRPLEVGVITDNIEAGQHHMTVRIDRSSVAFRRTNVKDPEEKGESYALTSKFQIENDNGGKNGEYSIARHK